MELPTPKTSIPWPTAEPLRLCQPVGVLANPAVVRTAQGSATVALITASGILAGMAQNANLGFNPVYLCLAIGAGAKLVPWMNDAGFWIMCKTSNLTEREALKTIAPMQTIMGLAGLILTMIAAQLFPMI